MTLFNLNCSLVKTVAAQCPLCIGVAICVRLKELVKWNSIKCSVFMGLISPSCCAK